MRLIIPSMHRENLQKNPSLRKIREPKAVGQTEGVNEASLMKEYGLKTKKLELITEGSRKEKGGV